MSTDTDTPQVIAEPTEPDIETATRVEKGRSVSFEWDLGPAPADDFREDRRALAVLSVRHHKAGINYFTYERTEQDYFQVSISREYTYKAGAEGFTMRSFTMGNGIGITRIPAGNRYSAKKLRDAEAQALKVFEQVKSDARVARYFDPTEDPQLRDRA